MARKKKTSWKRVVLTILCVILSLILVLLIAAAIFMDTLMGKIDRYDSNEGTLSSSELEELLKPEQTRGEDYTGPVYSEDEITMPSEAVEVIEAENIVNILLIGQDRRGTSGGNSLSDAMILCTINKENKTLTMTSFLRDIYVTLPGRGKTKLNVAYPAGGMELLDATLEYNFGVQVDGNVEVDFAGFTKIIDLLGGVDIELTGDEAAHLNHNYGFWLKAGMNHLNGEEALAYSRIRRLGTDFGRTNRQRIVLSALIDQFRNASISQLTSTVTGLLEYIRTDMTDAEILGYVMELTPLLKDLTIRSQSVPVEGTYYFGDVGSNVDCIIIRDFEANRQMLVDTLTD